MCKGFCNRHGSQIDEPATKNGVHSVVPWKSNYDALTTAVIHKAESTVRWKSPLWHIVANIACTIRLNCTSPLVF